MSELQPPTTPDAIAGWEREARNQPLRADVRFLGDLLQARVNLENARYERLIARARLRAAMGQPVLDASRSGVNP